MTMMGKKTTRSAGLGLGLDLTTGQNENDNNRKEKEAEEQEEDEDVLADLRSMAALGVGQNASFNNRDLHADAEEDFVLTLV